MFTGDYVPFARNGLYGGWHIAAWAYALMKRVSFCLIVETICEHLLLFSHTTVCLEHWPVFSSDTHRA